MEGAIALVLYPVSRAATREIAQSVFTLFIVIFGALGLIVPTQGAIVGEKQQGTAAWVLSKPVSRGAFLAAKWIAHELGFFVTIILLQGSLAYARFAAAGGAPAPLAFLAAMGLLTLQLLGYLTLTLMLGTFFASQRVVAGIAVVLLFGQSLLSQAYAFGEWLPGALPLHLPAVLRGTALPNASPLIGTTMLIVVCALLAIWHFEREELESRLNILSCSRHTWAMRAEAIYSTRRCGAIRRTRPIKKALDALKLGMLAVAEVGMDRHVGDQVLEMVWRGQANTSVAIRFGARRRRLSYRQGGTSADGSRVRGRRATC